jgi:KDO2-lipid IV(A) lauroyltransferase
MSKRKQLIDRASIALLRWLEKSLKKKTPAQRDRAGARLCKFLGALDPKRKQVALENLKRAFPDMPEEERKALIPQIYSHFGMVSADFLAGFDRTLEETLSLTEVEGLEHVDAALAAGKGGVFVTGHFGHWERAAAYLSLTGRKVSVVVRDADQDDVNALVNRMRSTPGTEILSRGNAARLILKRLKENVIVGIIADQNADEEYIPFFGVPAGTVLGPGVIAERTGAPALPVRCIYLGEGRCSLKFYPPLQPKQTDAKRGVDMMVAINEWLEEVITETPSQWLWIHDRWRSAKRKGLV